jgi:hypothetical protein
LIVKFYTLSLIFGLLTTAVFCQLTKIDTDRPDQTESAVTVPKKWFQFEIGLSKQANNKAENEFQYPSLLSKYGLGNGIELRLITTATTITNYTNTAKKLKESGIEPIEVGTKIALWQEKKWVPKTSLLFHVAIPTFASKNFKSNNLAPNFRFSMQHTITDVIGIGYNLGAEWGGINREATWIYTFAPGFNISDSWYSYIEAFGFISKTSTPQHNISGGVAWFASTDVKLDFSSGFGISKSAPDWYAALGCSFRFKGGK